MPIREYKIKDGKGNVVGIELEKFPANFIAETKEKADELYKKYDKTLQLLANKYSIFTGIEEDDLVQEGTIGLARASRDFEVGRSENFHIFAIYKIKDAMKEFVISQASNIRVPRYIRDASVLINRLKKIMESVDVLESCSLTDIWLLSSIYESNKDVADEIIKIKQSISNLADRSCTTTEQLIERAEMIPLVIYEKIDLGVDKLSGDVEGDKMIQRLAARQSIDNLKNYLKEDEFELLVDHYVYGKTVRELAEKLGIKAPSITVKIHNIVQKLNKRKDKILCYESDKATEETK